MTLTAISQRFRYMTKELKFFALASFSMGLGYSIIDATLNNFLNERFALSGFERSFLEFPRELPGLLVVFVSASLWFLCSRRLGALAMLLGAAGTLLMGFAATTYTVMVLCLFVYSMGQHLFLPLASSIGMELASEGKTGRRLGQLNSIRNITAVLGSFVVFLGFKCLNFNFHHTFVIAALAFIAAAILLYTLRTDQPQKRQTFIKFRREYRLYYILAILYGSRKQLFITFGAWVIVSVFQQPTQIIATLLTIGGVIGILFQPLLGWAVDHLGERTVLSLEAVLLVLVCLGYGFAKSIFSLHTAFLIICVCYLLDQMLMSVNMARATYMKKIALKPEDVQAALTSAVTIDHVFSISIAIIGGLIWNAFGYQYVFMLGVLIALANLVAALQIKLPEGQ